MFLETFRLLLQGTKRKAEIKLSSNGLNLRFLINKFKEKEWNLGTHLRLKLIYEVVKNALEAFFVFHLVFPQSVLIA